jgi:hypothetical protein
MWAKGCNRHRPLFTSQVYFCRSPPGNGSSGAPQWVGNGAGPRGGKTSCIISSDRARDDGARVWVGFGTGCRPAARPCRGYLGQRQRSALRAAEAGLRCRFPQSATIAGHCLRLDAGNRSHHGAVDRPDPADPGCPLDADQGRSLHACICRCRGGGAPPPVWRRHFDQRRDRPRHDAVSDDRLEGSPARDRRIGRWHQQSRAPGDAGSRRGGGCGRHHKRFAHPGSRAGARPILPEQRRRRAWRIRGARPVIRDLRRGRAQEARHRGRRRP